MIVCDKYKFVYAGMPKCATKAVHAWCREILGSRLLLGNLHRMDAPMPEGKEYFFFTIIRCPFVRAVSMWWSTTQRKNDDGVKIDHYGFRKQLSDPDDFRCFAMMLVGGKYSTKFSLGPPQSWFIKKAGRDLDVAIRFDRYASLTVAISENVEIIADILNDNPIKPVNTTSHERQAWHFYYDNEIEKMITSWAAEDFALFGYPPNVDRCREVLHDI